MSGIVDDKGVQWERCNGCGNFTRFTSLVYEKPTEEFKFGRDLCPKCAREIGAEKAAAEFFN